MSAPVESFINGMFQQTGAYVAQKYVVPIVLPAAEKTAEKTKEFVINNVNALYLTSAAMLVGAAIGGPVGSLAGSQITGAITGAAAVGTAGYKVGAIFDLDGKLRVEETGRDSRCVIL